MPSIKRHKAFLKDFNSARLTDGQFEKFASYVVILKEGNNMPIESKDHALKGNWSDFRECHLGGDMLLVYRQEGEQIVLARLGTHSEIFG